MVSDQKPPKEQREKAKQTIRAAFATGRIVEADHDQRLQAVDNAQTMTELAMITQGLDPEVPDSWRTYQPVGAGVGTGGGADVTPPAHPTPADSMEDPPEPGEPVSTWVPEPPPVDDQPYVPYGSPQETSSSGVSSGASTAFVVATGAVVAGRAISRVIGTVIAVGVALVVAVVGVGVSGGIDNLFSGIDDVAGGLDGAEVQTADGFADMLADLEERNGDTNVFEATLYPDYGIVYVPAAGGGNRYDSLIYRGSFSSFSKGTTDDELFDLSEIDPSVFPGLCQTVKGLIDEAGDCYIIVRRPGTAENGAWLSVYTSNDYFETAYLTAKLDGTEVSRYTS